MKNDIYHEITAIYPAVDIEHVKIKANAIKHLGNWDKLYHKDGKIVNLNLFEAQNFSYIIQHFQ